MADTPGRVTRVAFFASCLVDIQFPEVGRAVATLLHRLGRPVEFPYAQTCCGQMHINTGYHREGLALARHFVDVFESYDVVVGASPSCVASVRHQHVAVATRAGDSQLAYRASEVARKTYELSEFLVDYLGIEDVGAYFPHTVTYHPACHSLRLLKVPAKHLALLSSVRGIRLRDLPCAEECCGFGGTFAVKNPDVSSAMLADKIQNVLHTKSEVLTSGDVSCLMHVGGGLSRLRTGTRTLHIAEILASTQS